VSYADLAKLADVSERERIAAAPPEVVEQLEIQARYEGYVRRQMAEIKRHRATETLSIPSGIEYWLLEGLTYEAKDKLSRIRPATLGQASRIPGVSPADVSVLLIHLHRLLRHPAESVPAASPPEPV
jgi:tRNA uridine 5-carboxymethylaminomethyl modification enzyme